MFNFPMRFTNSGLYLRILPLSGETRLALFARP